MTRAQVDLARAAYALPGWRWHAGSAWRVPREAPLDDITGRVEFAPPRFPWQPYAGAIPDLSDPATIGAAIGILRAWSGDPGLCVTHYDGPPAAWGVSSVAVALIGLVMVDTEGAAIVVAAETLAAGRGR